MVSVTAGVGTRRTVTSVTSYADADREYADSIYGSLQGYNYFDAAREELWHDIGGVADEGHGFRLSG